MYVLTSFCPNRPARPGIYLSVWRARDTVQGFPAALLPRLLKPALGYTTKTQERSSVIYLSVQYCVPLFLLPCLCWWQQQAWWMTLPSRDSAGGIITEQVLAWSPSVPSRSHRFRLLHDPNLLKGSSDWRNRATVQALGINFDRAQVLYHPYSSLAASHLLPPFCSVLAFTLTQSFYRSPLPI